MAVLRAASVRGNGLGQRSRLVGAGCRLAGVVPLRPAAGSEMDHGQYRRPSRPSSGEPDSVLPSARGAARPRRHGQHQSPDARGQPALRGPRALGRKKPTAGFLCRSTAARQTIPRRSGEGSRWYSSVQQVARMQARTSSGTWQGRRNRMKSQGRRPRSCWESTAGTRSSRVGLREPSSRALFRSHRRRRAA